MKVLLTGATGYLGRQICDALREKGVDFTAVSRSPQKEAEFTQANILNPEGLTELCAGHDVLIHSAGLVSHTEEDSQRVWQIHVEGTQNILKAAKEAGIRRVIYLSTSGTIAVHTKDEPVATEDSPSPFPLIKEWPYYRSKLFAEQIALDCNAPDFEVICLNPSLLLGPGDTAEGVSTKPVRMFLDDELPVAPSGGIAFVDVRDVAEMVVNCIQKGTPGARYLLNGANMSFSTSIRRLLASPIKIPHSFRCQKSPGRPWAGSELEKNRRECGLDARASRCALGQSLLVCRRSQSTKRT